MKRKTVLYSLLLSLCAILLLCSCTSMSSKDKQAEPEISRAETVDLEYIVDEETKEVSTTLYRGEGYSIYVPDIGWTKKDYDYESWQADVAPGNIWLQVIPYKNCTIEEAKKQLSEKYHYYSFQEDERGWLSGYSDGVIAFDEVYFASTGENTFAAWISYPDESSWSFEQRLGKEASGYVGLLRAMAESLQVDVSS